MSAPRSQSVKDRLKAAKLPERSLQVCLRGDLQAEFDDLERQLREARQTPAATTLTGKRIGSKSNASILAARQEAVREEMADAMLDLRVRALPRADYVDEDGTEREGWQTLTRRHPPKPGDAGDEAMGVDLDGLMSEAIPRCVVEPELDEEDWENLNKALSSADFDRVFSTVWDVNRSGVNVPFSRLASLVMAERGDDSK